MTRPTHDATKPDDSTSGEAPGTPSTLPTPTPPVPPTTKPTPPAPDHTLPETPAQRLARLAALRKAHADGLAQATENLGQEIDAIIAAVGTGAVVTVDQLKALRANVAGCHAVAMAIAEGSYESEADA